MCSILIAIANTAAASRSKHAIEDDERDEDDSVSTKRESFRFLHAIICSFATGPRTGELLASYVKAQAVRDLPMANQEITYLSAFPAGPSSATRSQVAARAAQLASAAASPAGLDTDTVAAGPSSGTRGQIAARAVQRTPMSPACEDRDFDMLVQEVIGEFSAPSDTEQIAGHSDAAPVVRPRRHQQTVSSSSTSSAMSTSVISSPQCAASSSSTITGAPATSEPLSTVHPRRRTSNLNLEGDASMNDEHLNPPPDQAIVSGSSPHPPPASSNPAGAANGTVQDNSAFSPSPFSEVPASADVVGYVSLHICSELTSFVRSTAQYLQKRLVQVDVS